MACLWDVVEERSGSGSLRACLSERSEFAGPPLTRVPQRRHEVPDVQAGQLRPTLVRCDDVLAWVLVADRRRGCEGLDVYARRSGSLLLQRTAFGEQELGGVLRDALMVHFKVKV